MHNLIRVWQAKKYCSRIKTLHPDKCKTSCSVSLIEIFLVTYRDWIWSRLLICGGLTNSRIKKQFMIVRGSLFNKQVTVRSLFFLSEIFWNTNFKKFLLKMQALESEFSFKINFNPFWQAKRARSKAWGVRSGHHLYSAQVATYPWGQRIFSFFPGSVFNAAEGSFSSECFLYFDGQS